MENITSTLIEVNIFKHKYKGQDRLGNKNIIGKFVLHMEN